MKRWVAAGVALLFLFGVYLAVVYVQMRSTPAQFNAFMAGVPAPALMLAPFKPMWLHARAGTLQPGHLAPDFELPFHNGGGRYRLSKSRGVRPVLLIFGSYT